MLLIHKLLLLYVKFAPFYKKEIQKTDKYTKSISIQTFLEKNKSAFLYVYGETSAKIFDSIK